MQAGRQRRRRAPVQPLSACTGNATTGVVEWRKVLSEIIVSEPPRVALQHTHTHAKRAPSISELFETNNLDGVLLARVL